MPAPTHPRPHTETLANGLRVTLRHMPGLKRSAAVLRVAAGSHDAPLAWPGLAHFLEHLLFLGTERFPTNEALMAYVQRHGGQVNASTRERTTDFFFELPVTSFSAGLERLSDMLAGPRMNLADQRREREVLQAEFVAWSQDPTAQQQFALYEGLPAEHPLRGFHAGNRDSLQIESPAFQSELKAFHQRFYHTGQMILSLVGPQSIDELRMLALQFAAGMPVGDKVEQATPPPLAVKSYQQVNAQHSSLLLAFDALPGSSTEAMDFLCHWLNSAKPGGLLAHLQQQKLVDDLKATPLYQFAGQVLLHLQFSAAGDRLDVIDAQLRDWLSFFAQQGWTPLREEYAAVLHRREQVSGALQLARLDVQQQAFGLSESGAAALEHILREIGVVDNFSDHWHLPAANPFLRASEPPANAGLIRGQTSAHRGLRTFAQDRSRSRRERSPMHFSQTLPDNSAEGTIYLRWQVEAAASEDLRSGLQRSLRQTRQDASEAGVDVSFSTAGNQWLLKLIGLQEPMPKVLEHALKSLTTMDAKSARGEVQTQSMPIRQLLEALPEQCLPAIAASGDAQRLWTTSRWDGLALGLNQQTQSAMGMALSRIPGTPDNQLPVTPTSDGRYRWCEIATASSEHALLLICPTANREVADEAAWRLLAQLCQTPFYQRLRVELQLGYAVFSAFRQLHGKASIVFGVQSPTTSAQALLEHIQQFLKEIPGVIEKLDDASLKRQRQILVDQFDLATLSNRDAAELLWQGKLAGHSSEYHAQLVAAINQLDRPVLLAAAQRLIDADGGYHGLANEPLPGAPWQAAN
ncbi:MAG TPA: pyrroloquinoline quinone biosynthesis protein PqqF [Pseudomonas sp.]|uniref:pyrroloquinoline quinone biosynthesis protein PqqF n=1 Tax=Pseudomonas sp. TaxID=306 RepID=UPI002B978B67|nr:pyrroloquinoline quinone biosynthesis protein PqqF [Pseudomonas sp.]HWH86612.1 pyrroloquinoline quinone biosynthesis protein PqqF [Pseudomonas sp.]